MSKHPVMFDIEGQSPACRTSLRQILLLKLTADIGREAFLDLSGGVVEPVRSSTTPSRDMMEELPE